MNTILRVVALLFVSMSVSYGQRFVEYAQYELGLAPQVPEVVLLGTGRDGGALAIFRDELDELSLWRFDSLGEVSLRAPLSSLVDPEAYDEFWIGGDGPAEWLVCTKTELPDVKLKFIQLNADLSKAAESEILAPKAGLNEIVYDFDQGRLGFLLARRSGYLPLLGTVLPNSAQVDTFQYRVEGRYENIFWQASGLTLLRIIEPDLVTWTRDLPFDTVNVVATVLEDAVEPNNRVYFSVSNGLGGTCILRDNRNINGPISLIDLPSGRSWVFEPDRDRRFSTISAVSIPDVDEGTILFGCEANEIDFFERRANVPSRTQSLPYEASLSTFLGEKRDHILAINRLDEDSPVSASPVWGVVSGPRRSAEIEYTIVAQSNQWELLSTSLVAPGRLGIRAINRAELHEIVLDMVTASVQDSSLIEAYVVGGCASTISRIYNEKHRVHHPALGVSAFVSPPGLIGENAQLHFVGSASSFMLQQYDVGPSNATGVADWLQVPFLENSIVHLEYGYRFVLKTGSPQGLEEVSLVLPEYASGELRYAARIYAITELQGRILMHGHGGLPGQQANPWLISWNIDGSDWRLESVLGVAPFTSSVSSLFQESLNGEVHLFERSRLDLEVTTTPSSGGQATTQVIPLQTLGTEDLLARGAWKYHDALIQVGRPSDTIILSEFYAIQVDSLNQRYYEVVKGVVLSDLDNPQVIEFEIIESSTFFNGASNRAKLLDGHLVYKRAYEAKAQKGVDIFTRPFDLNSVEAPTPASPEVTIFANPPVNGSLEVTGRTAGNFNSQLPYRVLDSCAEVEIEGVWLPNESTLRIDVSQLRSGIYFLFVDGYRGKRFMVAN
ncbi:MAG: hypothetical protein AB8F78_09460 [Saprospiraceae bacterium]